MESSEHSTVAIEDIENSIQHSVDNVLLISNNNSKCGKYSICKICFYTVLSLFIILIFIILIVRLEWYK